MSLLQTLGLIALTLVPVLPPASGASPPTGPDGPRRSLEEMLAAERATAKAKLDALRPKVSSLLGSLRSLADSKAGDPRIALLRNQLAELGAPITPLLVTVIDPAEDAPPADLALALHVATVLEEMPLEAILDDLVHIAQTGSPRGRMLAVRVLGSSRAPARIGPLLADLYHNDESLRTPALRALCHLGGSDAELVLNEVLLSANSLSDESGKDLELIAEAMAALAASIESGRPVTPGQLAFLRTVIASRAARLLIPTLIQFIATLPPESLAAEDTERLVALASDRLVSTDDRVRLLTALPDLGLVWERGMSRSFDALLDESTPKLVEAGLICLARFGDKGAKKKLMKPYKAIIADKRNEPSSYEARGAILIRLGDFDAAITDYKKAIKLYAEKKKSPYASNAAYTGLARAQCLKGDIRGASKSLDDSSLSTVQLRALAKSSKSRKNAM